MKLIIAYNKSVPEDEYLSELKRRAKESRVYKKHQLFGLEIAQILEDEKHKSLYIKLSKSHNPNGLMRLARGIADKKNIKNKGAYFMSCLLRSEGGSASPAGGSKKNDRKNPDR